MTFALRSVLPEVWRTAWKGSGMGTTGVAETISSGLDARLARLACVPADHEGAIAGLQAHVCRAWANLGDGTLVQRAILAAAPVFPCLPHVQTASLEDLMRELGDCLASHHPAEIRVAAYSLLCHLIENVRMESGDPGVQALLRALEQS
jgi:hypothetical protein